MGVEVCIAKTTRVPVRANNDTARIDEPAIEALAEWVAGLLQADARGEGLVDAEELARRHGVSRSFVYQHAEELGVIRLGFGARPRLRFDPAEAARVFGHSHERPAAAVGRPPALRAPGRRAGPPEVDGPLLTIRSR
jgi:hypothetical protein